MMHSALAQRDSGLIVPAHLAHASATPDADDGIARDPDGRRRLVLRPELRRLLTRLARELAPLDLAIVLACKTTRSGVKTVPLTDGTTTEVVADVAIDGRCGEILLNEGGRDGAEGIPDPGYGCHCTRVHYLAGGAGGRP